MKASRCRELRCGVPIVFVTMDTGRQMPVDPVPDERGNIIAKRAGGRYVQGAYSAPGRPTPLDHDRLMPHYATCVAAKRAKPRPAAATRLEQALRPPEPELPLDL